MSKINISLLIFSLLWLGMQTPVFSQNNDDIRRLLEQGHYWYGRGQLNLAESAWEKVLSMEPGNKEARDALQDILAVNLETMVDRKKLKLARQLASDQHYNESLRVYEDAFNGDPPTNALSAEYHETLAGTEQGWGVAIAKFESLVDYFPSNPRYALTLARLKTYRDESRREGISALLKLSQVEHVLDKDVRKEALKALREALIWLDASEQDRPIYNAYLDAVPKDNEIHKKLSYIIHGDSLKNAYALLNKEKLEDAAQEFNRILEMEPDAADSLAGLGFVKLKQKEFYQADTLFLKAIEMDPTKEEQLRSAQSTARYWSLLNQARYAYEEKNLDLAEELVKQAQELDVKEIEDQMLLATLATEKGELVSAIEIYREIIKRQPDKLVAVESLLTLLLNAEDEKEALRVASIYNFPKIKFKRLRARLNSERLRARANKAIIEGGHTEAFLLLQEARSLNPNDPWISFELSKLYLQQGQSDKAYALFDGLLNRRPHDVDALYAKAIFCAEAKNWLLGMDTLERIPQDMRSVEHQSFQRALWSSHQKYRVGKLLEQGDIYNAELVAEEVRKYSDGDSKMLMTYAEILYDMQKSEKALITLQKALAMNPAPDMSFHIQYAGFLLKLNKITELHLLLDQLQQKSSILTHDQRDEVDRIKKGLAIRQAYDLRDAGDVTGAYERLLPWLQSQPNDSDILQIAALLYTDVGEHKQALALFKKLLAVQPTNINVREGAVNSAIAVEDFKTAQILIDEGLVENSDSPRLYAMRGRLSQAQGNSNKAAENFRNAIDKYQTRRAVRVTDTYVEGAFGGPRLAFVEGYAPLSDAGFPFEPLLKVKIDKIEAALDREISEPKWIKSTREELSQLESQKDKIIWPGFKVRNRNGDSGLDELTELEAPFRFKYSLDYSSQIGVSATPVALQANDVDGSGEEAKRFGSLAVDLEAFEEKRFEQSAEGLALAASYQTTDWSFDIGTTPLGFLEKTLVGGLEWSPNINGISPGVIIERRAVTESVLSYAGTKDPQTGGTWGGVRRTGLGLSIAQDKTQHGVYGKISAYSLKGNNVKDNNLININGGAYWKTLKTSEKELTIGVHVSYMKYEHNLRYFTLGHGGYFSPQRHISIVFPVELKGDRGPLTYRIAADIGMQNHHEDSIAFYPENSTLQAQLETVAATDPDIRTHYDDNSDTGAVYNLKAEFEYQMDQRLSLGGGMLSGHANNYDENSAFVFVRYSFDSK